MLRRSMLWWWNRRPAQRPSRRVAPDGVGYTWAEFDSYFDADITAAIWEAAEVAAASEPNSPRFDLPIDQGSILSS